MSTLAEEIAAIGLEAIEFAHEWIAGLPVTPSFEDKRSAQAALEYAKRKLQATLEGMAAPGETFAKLPRGGATPCIGGKVSGNSPSPVRELVALLREVQDRGLIYWEPNTARGYVSKAQMVEKIRRVLELNPNTLTETLDAGDSPSPQQPTQEDAWFAFLCQKYVQRADDRQKEMGLQYTEAETHDLAKECDRFAAQRVTAAPVSGNVWEIAQNIADRLVHDRWRGTDDTPAYDITGSDSAFIERASLEIAAALTAATDKARRETIEECALLCERFAYDNPPTESASDAGYRLRDRIRALALTPQNPGDAAPERP
jgi:hypothetical protein